MNSFCKSLFVLFIFLFHAQFVYPQWVLANGFTGSESVYCIATFGTNCFAGPDLGVYKSVDNGASWDTSGLSSSSILSLITYGTNVFAGTIGEGIYRSTNNGKDWTLQNTGLTSFDIWAFAIKDTNIFAGADDGVYISANNGDSWTLLNSDLSDTVDNVYCLAVNGNHVFAGTTDRGVHISDNNGTEWQQINNGLSGSGAVYSLIVSNNKIFAGTDSGVFLSSNNGDDWEAAGLNGITIHAFAVSTTNLFAGGDSLYLSTNSGTNWASFDFDYSPYSLSVSGTNILAGIGGGLWIRPISEIPLPVELSSFATKIQGRNIQLNWQTKTEKNSNKFEIERMNSGGNINNSIWQSVGSVKAADLSNSTKQYSFTDNNLQKGKYQYRLKMIDNDGTFEYSNVVEADVALPNNFELSQNYPNPFNPTTRINYSLPFDSNVSLDIYNIVGEKVAQLVNQEQAAGYYSVDFNSSVVKSLSSGVYLYRIHAVNNSLGKDFSSIKKMIMLK
jgi:hypothetical protein